MRAYHATGQLSLSGLLAVIVVALVAAAVIGGVAHAIGNVIWLLILFPLGMGFLLGAIGVFIVKVTNTRAPLVVGLIFVIAGTLTWSMDHVLRYVRARAELREQVEELATKIAAESDVEISASSIDATVSIFFEAWGRGEEPSEGAVVAALTQQRIDWDDGTVYEPRTSEALVAGLIGSVRTEARAGVSIRSLNLGHTGTWILWAIEFLIIVGIGTAMAVGQASSPACGRCGSWYPEEGREIPIANATQQQPVEAALRNDEAKTLAGLMEARPVKLPALTVRFRACGKCESDEQYVELVRVKFDDSEKEDKIKVEEILAGLVPTSFVTGFFEELERVVPSTELEAPSS